VTSSEAVQNLIRQVASRMEEEEVGKITLVSAIHVNTAKSSVIHNVLMPAKSCVQVL